MDKEVRTRLDALRSYTRRGAFTASLDELADRYTEETDRGAVVIFGSLTEDLLEERILQNFVKLDDDRLKQMTRFGVLNNWGNKISIALGLGIITENDAEILEMMKTMRNACAHSRLHIDFRTPELRTVLQMLLGDDFGPLLEKVADGPNVHGTRALYIQCCSAIWARIKGQSREPYFACLEACVREMLQRVQQKSSPRTPKKRSTKADQSGRKK
jgi:hypothetical protein